VPRVVSSVGASCADEDDEEDDEDDEDEYEPCADDPDEVART
jgi:hypothetical protein